MMIPCLMVNCIGHQIEHEIAHEIAHQIERVTSPLNNLVNILVESLTFCYLYVRFYRAKFDNTNYCLSNIYSDFPRAWISPDPNINVCNY
jgi:hypothetical protein